MYQHRIGDSARDNLFYTTTIEVKLQNDCDTVLKRYKNP